MTPSYSTLLSPPVYLVIYPEKILSLIITRVTNIHQFPKIQEQNTLTIASRTIRTHKCLSLKALTKD